MSSNYRTSLHFVRANPVKEDMEVETSDGLVFAEKGDYVVLFPNEARTVMKKAFFEYFYEDANQTTFADICMDFDGVINSYVSGWIDAATIPDPPVPGAMRAIRSYVESPLSVAIYSARSAQPDGINSMRSYIDHHDAAIRKSYDEPLVDKLLFPYHKPASKVYLDDRAIRFEGQFPTDIALINAFATWNEAEKLGKIRLQDLRR